MMVGWTFWGWMTDFGLNDSLVFCCAYFAYSFFAYYILGEAGRNSDSWIPIYVCFLGGLLHMGLCPLHTFEALLFWFYIFERNTFHFVF